MLSTKVEQWLFKRIVKRWCYNRFLVGSDFESAYWSWIHNPDGTDGMRIKRIVEDYIGKD